MKHDDTPVDSNVRQRAAKHFLSSSKLDGIIQGRQRKAEHIMGLLRPFLKNKPIRKSLSIGSSYCIIESKIKDELIPNSEFICTDMDEDALGYFKDQDLTKKVMSATNLEFEDSSFDFILAHQVLEHINAYPIVLSALRRLCRPGGMIYINVPNPRSPMVIRLANGKWPRPLLKAFIRHNAKKFKRDFIENTEKYHTGFTKKTLIQHFPDFDIHDVRKERLKQELSGTIAQFLITLYPKFLLFLFVDTNIWVLTKK